MDNENWDVIEVKKKREELEKEIGKSALATAVTEQENNIPTKSASKGSLLASLVKSGKELGRGLLEGALGMPESVPGSSASIPYNVGQLPGTLMRNKMGVPTSGEATKSAMTIPGTQQYQNRTQAELIDYKNKREKTITSPEGLTSEQQIQARALSKKIYGVRGAEFGLPAVYEEMRKGKNIDEIEDSLRYAGQSKEFAGPIREAAQSILINTPQDKAQQSMDYIDDLLSRGNTEGTKNQLKRLARTQAGTEQQGMLVGKERTIKLLDEIQGDLNNLEKMGVNTNIFTGTEQDIANKIGTTVHPAAQKLATKISGAIQNYRRSMTGVQFGMPENKEYKVMFPSIGRTANFNSANINGLKEVMQGDLDNFYSLSMGEDVYNKVFGSNIGKSIQETPTNDRAAILRAELERRKKGGK